MFQLKTILLIVWLSCLACTKGFAQKYFPFSQYQETGNKTIFCTFRDADGVWWSGTSQGLFTMAQLMGQTNHVYSRHPELENVVVQIQQDNLKRLWLKTLSNQYMVYDPRNNELISDVETYLQNLGIKVWYDFRAFVDAEGIVWFHKDHQLYSYDFRRKILQATTMPAWAGRIIGIAFRNKQGVAVTQKAVFQLIGGKKKYPKLLAHTPLDFQYDMALVDLSDKGDVWVYSNRKLFTYFFASKSWVERQEEVQYVPAILRMPNDQLFVATSSKGILVYDGNGKLQQHLWQSMPYENGLTSNHIQSLCYDARSHAISVGYCKHGLSFFLADAYELDEHPIQWSTNMYHLEDVVSLSPADGNSVWLGTEDNGIYRVKTDGSHQILENKFPKMTATAVLQDSQGKTWVGAFCRGLLCCDGRHFLQGESPYKIIEINAHRFIVLLNGKGMLALDPQTGKTTPIPTENPWVMDAATKGDYLFAATPLFLYKVNVKTLKTTKIPASIFQHSSFSNGNRTLIVDSRGWVWLVNHKGRSAIDVYDTKNNRAFLVSQLKDYDISSLREDGHGNVWCATDKGLVVVKVHQKFSDSNHSMGHPSFEVYCYTTKSTSMFNYRAMMNVDANHLLIGTTKGYLLVDAQRLERSSSKKEQLRQVVISSLRINGNYVSPGEKMDGRVVVNGDLPYLKQLHLKSSENNIILECLPKEIFSNELNSYEYKLEGTDVDWMPIDNHIISLSNLEPGDYKLLVRGQDVNHGKYQAYTLLEIEIDPPLWKSAWAYLLYFVFILMATYATYRYLRHRQEIKQKVQELRFEAEQEKRLNEMKLKFFTNISHDLRTPLTLIVTPVEEMMNTVKDKGLLHILGIVHNNALALYRLVNQILDFRKLENGDSRLNLSYGDIVFFLKNILQEYDLLVKKQGLSLAFDTEVEKFDMFFDKEKVENVATNVLSNAIKYTPNGGQVGLRIFHEGKQLRLDFWDTGIGIPDEDKSHVFDRFYMTHQKSSEFASSGIGLNIVKEFVDLWQGKVEVLDNHPKGTVFRITIPIKTSTDNDVLRGEEEQQGGEVPKLPIVKSESTVLLVEDNVELLDYLSQMLSREYTVCQATDGLQALDILKATDVDVVVSDVMMDGMDGFTLCKRLKGDINTSHIPIVLLTAKTLSQDEMEGLSLGANDYITKPFHMDVLRLRIRSVLERVESFRKKIKEENEVSPSEVTVTTLDEQLLSDIIKIVEENMGNADFNVETLCEKLCMHRSNLYKKVQFISGRSPAQFIRMMRLKRSKQLMSRGNVLISQVAYEVGFNDPKKFARYFKEEFGMLPSDYMKQQEG